MTNPEEQIGRLLDHPFTRRSLVKRGIATGVSMSALGAFISACGGDDGGGGLGQLALAASATPQTLDGDNTSELESWEAQWNCYEQLVSYKLQDAEENVRPADISDLQDLDPRLAEEWEFSGDRRTVTFKLREGVESAFGNTLTTEDVKWSFDRMAATEGVRSFVMFIGGFGADDVEIIDKLTFSITSETENPLLLQALALYLANIYDSTEVKRHVTDGDEWATEWLQRNTAGFGPYNVTSLRSGQQAVFEAHEGYWRGSPSIKRITYREVPEGSNRLSLLSQGSIQLSKDLSPAQLQRVDKTADYKGGLQSYVHFNVAEEPFNDLDVRKALAFATPYEDILRTVYRGTAEQLRGPVIDIFPDFFGDEFWEYELNPDRAREFLSRAGLEGGFELDLAYNSAQGGVDEIAILLKGAWQDVGVQTRITRMDPTTFGARKQEKDLPIFLDVNLSQVPDPGYVALLWFQPDSIINYGNYENGEVNELANQSLSTYDAERRSEIARELQRILIDDLPWIYLAQPGFHVGLGDTVESVTWYPNTALTFYDIRGS